MTVKSTIWHRQAEYHQKIAGKLFTVISQYIDNKGGTCEPYIAPFAVFLNEDDRNYVEPDISVICDTSKLNDKGCTGAPDWIIEIVSPGSQAHGLFYQAIQIPNCRCS